MDSEKSKISRYLEKAKTLLAPFYFLSKAERNDNGFSSRQTELDKKLIYSLAKSKIPNLRQIKYLKRFLSRKELILINLCLAIIFINLFILGYNFYKNHVKLVPVLGGEYIEGLIGAPEHINPLYAFPENYEICEGETYVWQGSDYNTAGTYIAEYTSFNGCDSIYQLELTVNLVPIAGFSFETNEAEVTFTNTSSNASSYLWDFGDGNTETLENPIYTYAASGDYSVVLTAYNDYCGESTDTQSVSATTRINSIEFGDIAMIYPNPSKGIFYFVTNNHLSNDLIVKIIDVNGQVVYANYQITKTIEKIDLRNYAKGIYFIQVRSEKYVKTKKLIIE